MWRVKNPSKVCTFTENFALLQRRKQSIADESNHSGTEQESFSEQQRFIRMEIAFTLRKNGGHTQSSLGENFKIV